VMETAHGLGVQSTATFMMGTGETNAERIEHLRMIRDVQDRTGGFRSFIPWTYQPENNHLRGRTLATVLVEVCDAQYIVTMSGSYQWFLRLQPKVS